VPPPPLTACTFPSAHHLLQLASSVGGGTCNVSAGRRAVTLQVVFFINYFQRWSFLVIQWADGPFLAKERCAVSQRDETHMAS
jgi:hypothetical protein